ncbi:Glycosyl transferase, family 2 [Planktothrix serta PCC 8927]|uniref:4,4'-diaponeurosporenoate glycosyltransferase n=1 Tax=Planktothrix serta PCC 8927 TaxID=671068 RepID=A0A7Z9E2X1_9CYAN|nr:TIGR04283 family arsenosugar biosynthesis glycosyltransferase [Planktothrix serta]VXD22768.1 Glycosyl transferase, family 2 [Planktothrix serta PCC 8927]
MNFNPESAKISIIIPVLNEAENIESVISGIQNSENIEIIIVDGGSQDNTVQIAQNLGVNVIVTHRGRGLQMNAGAKIATGEILLFLHGDTQLPLEFEIEVRKTLIDYNIIAGAFQLKINAPEWSLRLIEKMVFWRSKYLQMPYGDQAIFIKASTFWNIGGFPEQPIMEDFELIRRLNRLGKIEILSSFVITSGRRWQKLGVFQTTLINQFMIIGYYWGISPIILSQWYRKEGNTKALRHEERKKEY